MASKQQAQKQNRKSNNSKKISAEFDEGTVEMHVKGNIDVERACTYGKQMHGRARKMKKK